MSACLQILCLGVDVMERGDMAAKCEIWPPKLTFFLEHPGIQAAFRNISVDSWVSRDVPSLLCVLFHCPCPCPAPLQGYSMDQQTPCSWHPWEGAPPCSPARTPAFLASSIKPTCTAFMNTHAVASCPAEHLQGCSGGGGAGWSSLWPLLLMWRLLPGLSPACLLSPKPLVSTAQIRHSRLQAALPACISPASPHCSSHHTWACSGLTHCGMDGSSLGWGWQPVIQGPGAELISELNSWFIL